MTIKKPKVTTDQAAILDEIEASAVEAELADAPPIGDTTDPDNQSEPDGWQPLEPSADAVESVHNLVVGPILIKVGDTFQVKYPAELVFKTARAVAAVGEKYSVEPPAWFQRWYEELNLARLLATVGAMTWWELRKQQQAAAAEPADGDQSGSSTTEP